MSITSTIYTPKLEALNSLMLGIALTLATTLLVVVLLGIFSGEIWHAASRSFHADGAIRTLQSLLFGLLVAPFSLGVWYAILLLFALPQYFLIVLPLLKLFSSNLQTDAKRSWIFYVVLGVLIGGLPWLGLAFVLFDNSQETLNGILKLFVLPAFIIGAVAGGVLKYRLSKLAAAARIENNLV
jgi:Ca2+/Na+ antiporter